MKRWLTLFFVLQALCLAALNVPVSEVPVLTDANMLTGLLRVDPDDKAEEQLQTKAWLWQDDTALVVHFEAEIDDTHNEGSLSVRDEGTRADYLRVQLITIPDAYYSYYYVAYPLGNLVDGVRNSDLGVDYSWNSHYTYSSTKEGNIWKVTMRIPLEELRFKQEKPYNWKIILTRYREKAQESYSYPAITTKMGTDYFLNAQDIVLEQPVKHKLDVSLKPYYVKSYDLISHSTSWDPEHLGLDIALNPGQRTRIKVSLNPDFSDVPLDDAQDNYNSKYPPYYYENRFFFTEDLNSLSLDSGLFYSRSIVQPRFAFKATGNSNALNWGVLGAFDKQIDADGILINPNDYFQVLALNPSWRTLRINNAVVSRMNKGYYNHAYSGSLRWEFLPHFYFTPSLILSAKRSEEQAILDPLFGYQANASLSMDPGDVTASLSAGRISKDLRLDAGYMMDTDLQYAIASFGVSKSYASGSLRSFSLSTWANGYQNNITTSPLNTYNAGFFGFLNFKSKIVLNATLSSASSTDLYDGLHNTYGATFGGSVNRWQHFGFSANYTYARSLVYALSETYPRKSVQLGVWGSPIPNLDMSLSGNWTVYGYPELNPIIVNGEATTLYLDSKYIVANAEAEYTPLPTLRISLGSGLSTYEQTGNYASLSYYGNLRYEFKPEYFLYLGLKSAQTQDTSTMPGELFGHFRRDLATIYAKLSVTL
jgi:hypothetical protein